MRRALYLILLTFVFPLVGSAHAQSAKEAVRAFSELEARVAEGISFSGYVAAIRIAGPKLKSLEDSPDSERFPELQKALRAALRRYIEAQTLWGLFTFGQRTLASEAGIGKSYLAKYPDAAKKLSDGGAVLDSGEISIESFLPFLWKDAAQQVAAARKFSDPQ